MCIYDFIIAIVLTTNTEQLVTRVQCDNQHTKFYNTVTLQELKMIDYSLMNTRHVLVIKDK